MKFTPADLKLILEGIAHDLETHKDHLCELDSEVGDGDHGVSITIGMRAIRRALRELPDTALTFEQVWRSAAEAFADDVGASIGPLYEAAFSAAAEVSRDKTSLGDLSTWAEIVTQMAAAIQTYRTGYGSPLEQPERAHSARGGYCPDWGEPAGSASGPAPPRTPGPPRRP